MNSAWKIVQPKAKPRTYSRIISAMPVMPRALESTAPARMPTPSPATQCMVDPSVHARHGRGHLSVRPDEHVHVRVAVDESPDGGNDADHDDPQEARRSRGQS